MARALSGSGQYLSRTNPTGIVVNAAWTFLSNVWITSTGVNQLMFLAGTQGATLTRGFVINAEDVDRFYVRIDGDSLSPSAGLMTSGAWHRFSLTHSGSGNGTFTVAVDGTQLWSQAGGFTIPELSSGDMIRFGSDSGFLYYSDWNGRFAWSAWIQGVALSVAAADNYLNQTGGKTICSLITDYGTSGGITANALKGLWPFQSGNVGQDISGVGNDLTDTSTTNTGDPAGYPANCSGGGGSGGLLVKSPKLYSFATYRRSL